MFSVRKRVSQQIWMPQISLSTFETARHPFALQKDKILEAEEKWSQPNPLV